MMMTTPSMTLAVFVGELRDRLDALAVGELREILLALGQGLPASDRAGFLDLFPPAAAAALQPGRSAGAGHGGELSSDDELSSDIEAFVSDLERGEYFLGYGWDDEIRDQRSFGDESWVMEMDDLFSRADAVFLGGNMPQAGAAYAALFRAFQLEDEVGAFCGQNAPTEMVSTDLREASARYLRAIYHTADAGDMPADLRDAWNDDLRYLSRPTSIDEVRQALAEDLPGLDDFWPRWADELRSFDGDPLMRALRAEAVLRSDGVEGLAGLAREGGDRQADHCMAWIDALAAEGRDAEAVAAAKESLMMVARPGPSRARVADRLADLADRQPQPAALLDARRAAWHAEPTSVRLRVLYDAAPDAAVLLAAEVAHQPGRLDDRLQAELLLLAGEVGRAVGLLDGDNADRGGISALLLPYLLAAGSGAPAQPDWTGSALSVLYNSMDHRWGPAPQSPPTRLPDLLLRGLADLPPRGDWLETAGAEVDRVIHEIVSRKQQGRYGEAAALAVCHAEALAWSGGHGAARVESLFSTYPRHSAFKDQLRKAVARSPKMTRQAGGVL